MMTGLVLLGVVALVAGFLREKKLKRKLAKGEMVELPTIRQVQDMECCGQHEVCEKESLLAAVSKQVEYYNDEELDRFRGVRSDEYLPEEVEEFREVLYTMRTDEVEGWLHSLKARQVILPDELKDEVFLFIENVRH